MTPVDTTRKTASRNRLPAEYARLVRKALGRHVMDIILFGSHARGDAGEGADYDCVVIVDHKTPDVREVVLDADVAMLDRHGSLFAALLYDESQWQRVQQSPLGWNIRREGVRL